MDISVDELNALTEKSGQLLVRISGLERDVVDLNGKLDSAEEEIARLTAENQKLKEAATTLDIENNYLRTVLILSAEKVKEFVKRLTNIDRWSFLRTFVEWTLPDKGRSEQQALVNELMALPREPMTPNITLDNPSFDGPMFDVHDNGDVKLSE